MSIKVKKFNGYKFIYDNNSFIVDLVLSNTKDNLNTLYTKHPEFLEIDLNNEEI